MFSKSTFSLSTGIFLVLFTFGSLFAECTEIIELNGQEYCQDDIQFVIDILDNNPGFYNQEMDADSNGTINVLELGNQSWENNRLEIFECSFCGLAGPLPVSIGELDSLWYLNLKSNEFTGNISANLSGTSLQYFKCANNNLSGALPESLSELNIISFSIYNNQLVGEIPESYSNWQNLQEFNISQNYLNGEFPQWLGDISSLSFVSTYDNLFTGSLAENLCIVCLACSFFDISDNFLCGEIPECLDEFIGDQYCNELLWGDLNLDEDVNVTDIVMLVQFILNHPDLTSLQYAQADVSQDGLLNVADIVLIVNLILG